MLPLRTTWPATCPAPSRSQGPYMGCFQATAASGERLFCVDLNFKITLGAPEPAAGAQEAAGTAAQLAAQ